MAILKKVYSHIKHECKISTSLFLLAILCLENMSMPANATEPLLPQYEPTQHISSNPNLFVSAENSFFENYFAGPQVIQVIITDPNIDRLDQAYGEPDVTVNGKKLRMAQATDGNWYAYFADSKQAQIADSTQTSTSGKGLDFGKFCSPASAIVATGVEFSQTNGIAIARSAPGSSDGSQNPQATVSATCTGIVDHSVSSITGAKSNLLNHVVRENKTLNTNSARAGQIAQQSDNQAFIDAWPIIQLYDFGPATKVTVQYNAGGSGVQSVELNFDRIPSNLIGIVSNRQTWPRGAHVHGDLIDPQLNIDPTEEDSWTWGTSMTNNTVYYQAFDRSGNPDADGTIAMQNLSGNLTSMMFNHNGRLTQDPEPQGVAVATLQPNGIQKITKSSDGFYRTKSINEFSIPLTILELQPNVGIFGDYDASGIAEIITLDNAPRDKSFTVNYNDKSYTVRIEFSTATLTMGTPAENTPVNPNPPIKQSVSNQSPINPVFAAFLKLVIMQNLFLY
ncbi:hypothetical protein [Candidatus Nitrosotalea okcheonensis]|uniref:Uncharacterized protein n=1 Tax=Candidatus Nitrosotalea okcheonensis TaxID=1903276 RepID=A0A2H1FF68_9ARCH|nr:hypothetical protein [Candidatus Nitrosotalea okcheonensis]SMH71405.1 conserved exported protein of unknown function [Candidatus Nitrosotalea okcheonensis]